MTTDDTPIISDEGKDSNISKNGSIKSTTNINPFAVTTTTKKEGSSIPGAKTLFDAIQNVAKMKEEGMNKKIFFSFFFL